MAMKMMVMMVMMMMIMIREGDHVYLLMMNGDTFLRYYFKSETSEVFYEFKKINLVFGSQK